ncbi:MAG: hypothetical protein IPL46_27670 [Saprospiraceae bacterium]|nr:hypothetical protein [Saprospiraceae bacterium]
MVGIDFEATAGIDLALLMLDPTFLIPNTGIDRRYFGNGSNLTSPNTGIDPVLHTLQPDKIS